MEIFKPVSAQAIEATEEIFCRDKYALIKSVLVDNMRLDHELLFRYVQAQSKLVTQPREYKRGSALSYCVFLSSAINPYYPKISAKDIDMLQINKNEHGGGSSWFVQKLMIEDEEFGGLVSDLVNLSEPSGNRVSFIEGIGDVALAVVPKLEARFLLEQSYLSQARDTLGTVGTFFDRLKGRPEV